MAWTDGALRGSASRRIQEPTQILRSFPHSSAPSHTLDRRRCQNRTSAQRHDASNAYRILARDTQQGKTRHNARTSNEHLARQPHRRGPPHPLPPPSAQEFNFKQDRHSRIHAISIRGLTLLGHRSQRRDYVQPEGDMLVRCETCSSGGCREADTPQQHGGPLLAPRGGGGVSHSPPDARNDSCSCGTAPQLPGQPEA